jgi:hypothetical protein
MNEADTNVLGSDQNVSIRVLANVLFQANPTDHAKGWLWPQQDD